MNSEYAIMDGNFRRTERSTERPPLAVQGDPYRIEYTKKTDWTAVTIRTLVAVVLFGAAIAGYFYMRENTPEQSPFDVQTQSQDALIPPSFPPPVLPEIDAGAAEDTATAPAAEPSSTPAPANQPANRTVNRTLPASEPTPPAAEPTPPPAINEAPAPTLDPMPLDETPSPFPGEPDPLPPQ
jgi:hypothetical protein